MNSNIFVERFPWRGSERVVQWEGSRSKACKSTPQGGEYLIPRTEWGDIGDLHGNDEDILKNVTMNKAFTQVLEKHNAFHKIALFSLCTATRPYSKSRKWGRYIREFEQYADLIIHSNGGIIPIEFEGQFPYLNYDAHGEKKFDNIYISIGIERMKMFLQRHKYEYLLFNYRHNMRNFQIAQAVGPWAKENGLIKDFFILPTKEQYMRSKEEGFAENGYKMYPELWPTMFNPVLQQLKEWDDASSN